MIGVVDIQVKVIRAAVSHTYMLAEEGRCCSVVFSDLIYRLSLVVEWWWCGARTFVVAFYEFGLLLDACRLQMSVVQVHDTSIDFGWAADRPNGQPLVARR